MPTFNMAAQTPNGQPGGTEAVYTNGIPQTYPGREYLSAPGACTPAATAATQQLLFHGNFPVNCSVAGVHAPYTNVTIT